MTRELTLAPEGERRDRVRYRFPPLERRGVIAGSRPVARSPRLPAVYSSGCSPSGPDHRWVGSPSPWWDSRWVSGWPSGRSMDEPVSNGFPWSLVGCGQRPLAGIANCRLHRWAVVSPWLIRSALEAQGDRTPADIPCCPSEQSLDGAGWSDRLRVIEL